MKIVLIWPSLTTLGGNEKYYNVQAYGLAGALSRQGAEVFILTSGIISPESSKAPNIYFKQDGYYICCLFSYLSKRYSIMPGLFAELKKLQPDIIQAAEDISPATLIALKYCQLYKKTLFVYQGLYTEALQKPWATRLLRATVFKQVYKNAFFLTKSSAARYFLIKKGADKKKTVVVHVGFNDKFFYNTVSNLLYELTGFSKELKTLITVGTLIHRKNHRLMIQAMRQLRQDCPDVALAIFGNGPEYDNLIRLIQSKNLEDSVRIINKKIPQTEMHKIYSSSFACLTPSTQEIFGMTVLEAMACQRPVFGSPLGGMADIIKTGYNGIHVNPKNAHDLSQAIRQLIDNPDEYRRMCQGAYETSKNYHWDAIANRFLDAYLRFGCQS